MEDEAAFTTLIDKIVATHIPEEREIYNAVKSDLVHAAYKGKQPDSLGKDEGQFEFGESIIVGLNIIALIWGTYKTFKEVYQELKALRGKPSLDKIKENWRQKLIQQGLNAETASKVSAEFVSDAVKLAEP